VRGGGGTIPRRVLHPRRENSVPVPPSDAPARSTEPLRADRLRVATYNIHGGRTPENVLDLAAIAAVIRALAPDLVALQEVHQRLPATRCQPQAELLEGMTGLRGLFVPSLGFSLCGYGNVLLARTAPIAWQRHLLPSVGEQRSAIEATYRLPAGPIRVLATHFGLDADERLRQACALAAIARRRPDLPLIVMGDLNALPDAPCLAPLYDLGLRHALPPALPTFPAPDPHSHIDYLLVSEHWDVLAGWTVASLASDHLPGISELRLR